MQYSPRKLNGMSQIAGQAGKKLQATSGMFGKIGLGKIGGAFCSGAFALPASSPRDYSDRRIVSF